jgi:hypothetical protein
VNRTHAPRIALATPLALLLATTCAAAAEAPSNPLQPLALFAGHCFKGSFLDRGDSDEHCFQWLYGGKALRDTHTVRGASHPDYVGETTYYWDSATRRIDYLYIENGGGIMRGTVEPAAGALVFPAAAYVVGGQSMTLRVRWTLLGGEAYEAWSEVEGKDGWQTFFRVKMARTS